MGLRHRRLLPSVLVGGILVGGMAIGVGTAEAAGTCSIGGVEYTILSSTIKSSGGACTLAKDVSATYKAGYVLTSPDLAVQLKAIAPTFTPAPAPAPAPTTTVTVPSSTTAPSPTPSATTPPPSTTQVPPVAPPPAPPAPPVVAPAQPLPADQALLSPGFGATPAALTGAPFAPALGAGFYDPALLLGAPANSPLVSMASADPASAVTTASQVQAMALQNLPGGLGVPAVLGVIILAGLGGFVVRHRILRRVAKTAS